MTRFIDTAMVSIPRGFFEQNLNVPKLLEWLDSQPEAKVVSQAEYDNLKYQFDVLDAELSRLEEKDNAVSFPDGYWNTREAHNDYLWVECSECGYRVENYVAVKTGISSTDIVEVRWHFCPKCGNHKVVKGKK